MPLMPLNLETRLPMTDMPCVPPVVQVTTTGECELVVQAALPTAPSLWTDEPPGERFWCFGSVG